MNLALAITLMPIHTHYTAVSSIVLIDSFPISGLMWNPPSLSAALSSIH